MAYLPAFLRRIRATFACAGLVASTGCAGLVTTDGGGGNASETSRSNSTSRTSVTTVGGTQSSPTGTGPTSSTSTTVGTWPPSYGTPIVATAAQKVDLLFDIDNSASMGDKQSYLARAIPDLINRLVNPNCVDPTGSFVSTSSGGMCPGGSQLEFAPVFDMHLGIVTSALGSRLGDLCDPNAMAGGAGQPFAGVSAHNDDQGHLVARSLTYNAAMNDATEGSVAKAVVSSYVPGPSGFLWWYPAAGAPPGPLQPEVQANALITDFGSMVQGVGIWGCGIESQLESWYRFLIQPDPYASLASNTANPVTMWHGVDTQILQQRKDFLRPDSLVAIFVLTDENDSEVDVRSLNGEGYYFMSTKFAPPKATSACSSNPADPACVSCSVKPSDPACTVPAGTSTPYGTYTALSDWGYDPNLRHVHMKAKYGVDPQYPIGRYVVGLKSTFVPDRFGEYQDASGNPTTSYFGQNDCVNPLYAASLPDGSSVSAAAICSLQVGVRTPDQVFYAIIGGVPNQLLHFDPSSAANSTLSDSDWVRILGRGPAAQTPTSGPSYDYGGIDPHMIEDYRDRTTVKYSFVTDSSMTNPLVAAASGGTDPTNGREWITDQETTPETHVLRVDRQYACTFPLAQPRDCTSASNQNGCDCPSTANGLTPAELPPVCNPSNPTQQVAAKAYPTIRELTVARMMGAQGIVSSLCPIHVTDATPDGSDPLYGYRPAMNQLVDRLRHGLNPGCLPGALPASANGGVACRILVQLPASSGGTCLQPICDAARGLTAPDGATLSAMCAADGITTSVCALPQLTPQSSPASFDSSGTCASSMAPGWCYVAGASASGCGGQAIDFAAGSVPPGAVLYLVCP
jgi:hypothetical protein